MEPPEFDMHAYRSAGRKIDVHRVCLIVSKPSSSQYPVWGQERLIKEESQLTCQRVITELPSVLVE